MPLLLAYSLRNLYVRKLTNLLTAAGMALVVFVYAAVLMLDSGLKQTLVATGEETNVIFVRRSAEVEIQSLIDRRQARIIESQPEVVMGAEGAPVVSKEAAVLIAQPRRKTKQASNLLIRGVGPAALAVRPRLRLVEGRMFRLGSDEIIIGRALAGRFEDIEIGSSLKFAHREWKIVGRFDAGGSGFDSEIWADSEQLMQSFRRDFFSSVTVRLADSSGFDALKARLGDLSEADRLSLAAAGPVTVATPAPLTADLQTQVARALGEILPDTATPIFAVDPDLIAGAELRTPHAVVRNSWRADLDAMVESLNEDNHARIA
jgi:putative ABC transport system permease protein